VPLPKISVAWRQSKQGKGKSKVEQDLSLNLLGQPFQENGCLVCTVEAAKGLWKHLGPPWEAFHKMGLRRRALGRSCLMIVMFNGRPTESDWVMMQHLWRVNVMYLYMLTHTLVPNIAVIHKQIEVEMADGNAPPHKFTHLCCEFMMLTGKALEGDKVVFLFDAVIPIVSGIQASSAVVTYRTDNKEVAILITKIKRSVALWFFGYWTKIQKNKNGMIEKLMESFDMDAAKLAGLSEFDVATLTIHTQFGDIDEQIDGIEAKLGID
jgi:hypothetical protein